MSFNDWVMTATLAAGVAFLATGLRHALTRDREGSGPYPDKTDRDSAPVVDDRRRGR